MNIAIIHDFLNQYGGAERAFHYLIDVFPESSLFTSIYFPESTFDYFKDKKIKVSFMQKIPGINKNFKKFFFFYPFAFKRINLKKFEVIISSSSSFSHFINKSKNSIHIVYCYTPPRFLWETEKYLEGEKFSRFLSSLIKIYIRYLKKLDLNQSKKIDYYIAISENVKNKINKIYKRDAFVIYPPIDIAKYIFKEKKGDFYLIVSRLKGYKKLDIAIKAFNTLGKKLLIVGTGEDEAFLKEIAGENINFLGRIDESKLLSLYSEAKALIFPGEEDFGLTPLEAQASGTPVIAYGAGGALETIINRETGLFFYEQDPEELIKAVKEFENYDIDALKCRANAERFGFNQFRDKIFNLVNDFYRKNESNF